MTDIESGSTEIQNRIVGVSGKRLSAIGIAHRTSPCVVALQGIALANARIHICNKLVLAKAAVGLIRVEIPTGKKARTTVRDQRVISSGKICVDVLRSQAVDPYRVGVGAAKGQLAEQLTFESESKLTCVRCPQSIAKFSDHLFVREA